MVWYNSEEQAWKDTLFEMDMFPLDCICTSVKTRNRNRQEKGERPNLMVTLVKSAPCLDIYLLPLMLNYNYSLEVGEKKKKRKKKIKQKNQASLSTFLAIP
jgi:hypothetical protein